MLGRVGIWEETLTCDQQFFTVAFYLAKDNKGCLTVIIVHCNGNHFLNPEKWGSKSGYHGNVLYKLIMYTF